ncbi:unnamed protein product [Mycena citricolor]|uniref:poly(ADP-ribose) glycohydrolase n=1 Tax=Mycena citricolor TaxID=2018698 RepID=A0AAD2Q473_9AGAR|nr:unnamed protein product [Mycena citricolor]
MLLPNAPDHLVSDNFSLLDADTDLVLFWSLLPKIILPPAQSTSQLIEALESIAITMRVKSAPSYGFLRRFLDERWDNERFFRRTWARCVDLALEMSALFPDGTLAPLSSENPCVAFSARQIACLVVHQFLCTLPEFAHQAPDDSQDLSIWFHDDQPHPHAVEAYLTALFTYFDRIAGSDMAGDVSLTLCTGPPSQSMAQASVEFRPIRIIPLDAPNTSTTLMGIPRGACVISANSHIGFGRTASQEEMQVGCTPTALPAKLVTPPLSDTKVLVVRGCAPVVEMVGYGRAAVLHRIVPAYEHDWSQRVMLFMDALELDGYDSTSCTPDLLPGHIDRELNKALTAFASDSYEEVVTGHWGCGAFGGNKEIKGVVQWCAASRAGVELAFVCDTQDSFGVDFKKFVDQALDRHWKVDDVLSVLASIGPTDPARLSIFAALSTQMERRVPQR